MTTLRQIAANRKNASKSTGPVTDEGKDRSRRNALVHGLAGSGAVLPDAEADMVAERLASWRERYVLDNDEDEWTFHELVVNAVRVDACREREAALANYEAARALVLWDEDRRAEAEDLAARLSRDPGKTVVRLARSAAGCRWLVERWAALAAAVGEWSEAQVALAFDLMGVSAAGRVGDPWIGHGSPKGLAESRLAILRARLADGLEELDAMEREMAEQGAPTRVGAERARLQRYEAACLRRYETARSRLTRREPTSVLAEAVPPPPPIAVVAPPPPPLAPTPTPTPPSSVARPEPPAPSASPEQWMAYERALFAQILAEVDAEDEAAREAGPASSTAVVAASLGPRAVPAPDAPRPNRRARRAALRRTRDRRD